MSTAIKIFIFDDEDSLDILSVDLYEKLLRRDLDCKLLKYAGKRMRYASVVVELKDKIPLKVINAHYSYLVFDSEGLLDLDERGTKANLALEMLPPVYQQQVNHTIDARQKFARKRYDDRYRWQPSTEILAEIEKAIFGCQSSGLLPSQE